MAQHTASDTNKLSVTLSVRFTAGEREALERLVSMRLAEIHKLDAGATLTASALVRTLVLEALGKVPRLGERRSGRDRRQKAPNKDDLVFDARTGKERRRRAK